MPVTGIVTDYEGFDWELPVLLAWEVEHALGTPCDSFTVRFAYDPSLQGVLENAVEFRGIHNGSVVCRGLVDEFVVTADGDGAAVELNGRGRQALLLDNEASAVVYYGVGLDFLLENHVRPWGVTDIRVSGDYGRASVLQVNAGMSQWGVLELFCRFSGGAMPRFSPDGTLILGDEPGIVRVVDENVAVVWQRWSQRRYGVISQVLVNNRSWGSQVVDNSFFTARGGRCRRVVSSPRRSGYDALRYTGEYQIRESQRDWRSCQIELPGQFAAFPGDRVWLSGDPLGLRAQEMQVTASRCYADQDGAGTVLTMTYTEDQDQGQNNEALRPV